MESPSSAALLIQGAVKNWAHLVQSVATSEVDHRPRHPDAFPALAAENHRLKGVMIAGERGNPPLRTSMGQPVLEGEKSPELNQEVLVIDTKRPFIGSGDI